MNLKFEKINNWFVSEFEVTQDFNIHIEKEAGSILFYQRTAGSEYDIIHDLGPHKGNERIMDLDFSTFIYPKYIKIKSKVLPTVATLTTDGEVHELVYQEKSVEITSNGTTKVTADTGYTALGSVNVKVNVPTEGGGSGDTMEYFLVQDISEVGGFASLLKIYYESDNTFAIYPANMFIIDKIDKNSSASTNAVGLDFQSEYIGEEPFNGKLIDVLIKTGLTKELLDAIPRITKEEFYHIPQDEIWTLNTQEDYKSAWDKLYPLIERYGADYINENKLSLAPWYKSLTINGFGANNIIEYYVDIREDDEFIKNESIGFDSFALKRKEWNDGRVTFDFVEYEG